MRGRRCAINSSKKPKLQSVCTHRRSYQLLQTKNGMPSEAKTYSLIPHHPDVIISTFMTFHIWTRQPLGTSCFPISMIMKQINIRGKRHTQRTIGYQFDLVLRGLMALGSDPCAAATSKFTCMDAAMARIWRRWRGMQNDKLSYMPSAPSLQLIQPSEQARNPCPSNERLPYLSRSPL